MTIYMLTQRIISRTKSLFGVNSERLKFVTALSWVFIVLSGFWVLISFVQNILINTVFPVDKTREDVSNSEVWVSVPLIGKFILSNLQFLFLGFLVVSIVIFIASVGLLKRKNWARILFIFIMVLGILGVISSIFMQDFIVPKFNLTSEDEVSLQTFLIISRIFSVIGALIFGTLFTLIIKKLNSRNIKEEFINN